MGKSMKDDIVTAAAEALDREHSQIVDREAVIEALAHQVLEDCLDSHPVDESQVVLDSVMEAVNQCDAADYDIVIDAVRERVYAEFEKEATEIALGVIREMAAEARSAKEVEAA
jgi:L-rhamnose mutarotase